MPPKRATRGKALKRKIEEIQDEEGTTIDAELASGHSVEAKDEMDLLSVADSDTTPVSTPLRKRMKFEVAISTAPSTVTSTKGGSEFSRGPASIDTPATSLSDVDSEVRSSSRPRRAARTGKNHIKVELESDLSDVNVSVVNDSEDEISPVRGQKRSTNSRKIRRSPKTKAESEEDSDWADDNAVLSEADPVELVDSEADEVNPEQTTTAPPRARRRRPAANSGLSQYQKTVQKLIVHHPELESVWGDLEQKKIIEPVKAAQPEILTLKLLPFQLEGLYWLRTQSTLR